MSALRFAQVVAAMAALVALLALAPGCSDDDDSGPVGPGPIYSSIVIAGPDSVLIGDQVQFTATVLDTAGQPVVSPQITWSSSATGVATVSAAGIARGVSEGDVSITASGGGITSTPRPLASFPGYGWLDQSAALNSVRNLKGVFFIDGREGWIVGDLGSIYHTTDAGVTWSAQNSNSTGYTLNSVWFTNSENGIIVGTAGRVLRTTNGGNTWNPLAVNSDGGKGMNKVFFQDANRGWIVGNGGLILRSTNGGGSWTRVLPAVTVADLHDVAFPKYVYGGTPATDPFGHGWAVGNGGTIVQSDDFGQSWDLYTPFAATDNLFGVATHQADQSIAVGANNRVLVTAAIADTFRWDLAPAPTPFSNLTHVVAPEVFAVPAAGRPGAFGVPTTVIWAVGRRPDSARPVVLYSEDLAQSWFEQRLPDDAPLDGNEITDIYFVDTVRAWAIGNQGLVLHTVNGGR